MEHSSVLRRNDRRSVVPSSPSSRADVWARSRWQFWLTRLLTTNLELRCLSYHHRSHGAVWGARRFPFRPTKGLLPVMWPAVSRVKYQLKILQQSSRGREHTLYIASWVAIVEPGRVRISRCIFDSMGSPAGEAAGSWTIHNIFSTSLSLKDGHLKGFVPQTRLWAK